VTVATPRAAAADHTPSHRRQPALLLTALVGAAVLLRLPALFASRHLGFDDGVYGASALAMRAGEAPFRDVFSSQGPLFLPLVFLADLLGLRTLDAPRLLALLAAAGLVGATWSVARGLGLSPGFSGLAAALVGSSGSVLWVTGPLTSDGPALALATAAVALALAWRRAPSLRLALLAGLALGAALSIKSLLVAAAVPVGLVLWRRRRRHLGVAVAGAMVVGLGSSLPWGLGRVWDQSVAYHLEAAGSRTPLANARKVASTLGDRDLPLLLAAAAVAVAAVVARRRRTAAGTTPTWVAAAWLAATAAVLLLEHPLWRNHVAHLVPAAALLVAAGAEALFPRLSDRAQRRLFLLPFVLVLPYHLAHVAPVLAPAPPGLASATARADLTTLPREAWAISDEPGLVWRAGRRTPADLVDTSILRIRSGRITTASLAEAAGKEEVCAVLVWSSSRFGSLTDLPARLPGYREARRYGGPKVLYVKERCQVGETSAAADLTTTSTTAPATATTTPPSASASTTPGNPERFVGARLPSRAGPGREAAPGVVVMAATVVTEPFERPMDYVAEHVTQNGRGMLWLAKYLDAERLEVVDSITIPPGDVVLGTCRTGGRPDRKIAAVLRPGTATVIAAWRLDPATETITAVKATSVACQLSGR
jgi:hypothetical protein